MKTKSKSKRSSNRKPVTATVAPKAAPRDEKSGREIWRKFRSDQLTGLALQMASRCVNTTTEDQAKIVEQVERFNDEMHEESKLDIMKFVEIAMPRLNRALPPLTPNAVTIKDLPRVFLETDREKLLGSVSYHITYLDDLSLRMLAALTIMFAATDQGQDQILDNIDASIAVVEKEEAADVEKK